MKLGIHKTVTCSKKDFDNFGIKKMHIIQALRRGGIDIGSISKWREMKRYGETLVFYHDNIDDSLWVREIWRNSKSTGRIWTVKEEKVTLKEVITEVNTWSEDDIVDSYIKEREDYNIPLIVFYD